MTDSQHETIREAQRTITAVAAKAEYHEEWSVRRYDLVHVREDLDKCGREGRWLVALAAIFAGIAATALAAGLAAINSTPEGPLGFRIGYLTVAAATGVLAVVLFALDRRDSGRAGVDLEIIKGRVDELISMFDQTSQKQGG